MPEPVGTAALFVDETQRRLPGGDLGLPPHRQMVHAQAVVDQGADAHGDRTRGQDLETEPGWGQTLEVAGVRKELEDLRARSRQPGLGTMFEDSQPELLQRYDGSRRFA